MSTVSRSTRLSALTWVCALLVGLAFMFPVRSAEPLKEYDVKVEIENTSGEEKTDWPVILGVLQVLGRNLPAGSVNPEGFHVFNEKGEEIEHAIEKIPPLDEPGNDEIIFIIPKMAAGAKVTYRITNTSKAGKKATIDYVSSAHNLIKNGACEKGTDKGVEGWSGKAKLDQGEKRSGKASLLLQGTRRVEIKCTSELALHKGSRYYFGLWGKTQNVSRHALYRAQGGCFKVSGFDNGYTTTYERYAKDPKKLAGKKRAGISAQCATRDWAKTRFGTYLRSDWGIGERCALASAEKGTLAIRLDQRRQFFMPKNKAEGKWWIDDIVLIEQPKIIVRHDELLKPQVKDGLFVFNMPSNTYIGNPVPKRGPLYGTKPFPREKLEKLDRYGLQGQRQTYVIGVYHTRPIKDLQVKVKDGALKGPGGASLALTEIEFEPGCIGPKPDHQLRPHAAPVSSENAEGLPYFVVSFLIPKDAKPGAYAGSLEITEGGKTVQAAPIKLRVQDLAFPVIRDVSIGMIFQGDAVPFNDDGLKQYAKSGFTSVTRFGRFLKYTKEANGDRFVDIADMEKKLEWLKSFGITAGVNPFSDFDLGPQWNGGALYQKSKGKKEKYQREIKRIEEFVKKRPDLPRIIYMTWDEPIPGQKWIPNTRSKVHGGPCEMMNWVPEVAPNAPHTLDAHFFVFDKILKYYNMPCFDDPSNFCGPELYKYVKSLGKEYGFAGAQARGEQGRYQAGIMMVTTDAKYLHVWHLNGGNKLMDKRDGKVTRSLSMVTAGEGVDDFKIHRLLSNLIADAEKGSDAAKKSVAKEAKEYMKKVLTLWNADHKYAASSPYLGFAQSWGDEGFYNRWQEKMARYAAKLKGVKWVE